MCGNNAVYHRFRPQRSQTTPGFSSCQSQPRIRVVENNNNPAMHSWVILFKHSGSHTKDMKERRVREKGFIVRSRDEIGQWGMRKGGRREEGWRQEERNQRK